MESTRCAKQQHSEVLRRSEERRKGKVRRDGVLMSNSIGWRSTGKRSNRTVAV